MKILFLDIDGVCNHQQTRERFGPFIGINPIHVARVRRIIEQTGCSVVLSSSWRLKEADRDHVREKVCDFIDVTPDMQAGAKAGVAPRGLEVQAWLDAHPEVEKYAIVDDANDFLPGQHLFPTTFAEGITDTTADAVIAFLGAK